MSTQATDRLVLTVDEAMHTLGISKMLLYDLMNDGTVPSFKLGRRRLIPRAGLEKMIQDAVDAEVVQIAHAARRRSA